MRKTHIFFGNQHIDSMYCGKTKWQVMKWKVKRFIKRTMFVSAAISILGWTAYGSFQYARTQVMPVTVYADQVNEMQTKIDALKDKVVMDIMECERPKNDNPIIFDSNRKASVGPMQWQLDSVVYFVQKRDGRKIDKTEATMLALDTSEAFNLAKYVMFETPNMAEKDWVICGAKVNADQRIKIIKELEALTK